MMVWDGLRRWLVSIDMDNCCGWSCYTSKVDDAINGRDHASCMWIEVFGG